MRKKRTVIPMVARNLGGWERQDFTSLRRTATQIPRYARNDRTFLEPAFAHTILVEEILRSRPPHHLAQDDCGITSAD